MKKNILFGGVSIGANPKVVAVVGCGTQEECRSVASEAKRLGADIIEFRADQCESPNVLNTAELIHGIKEETSLPILLTVRDLKEGGYFFGSDEDRLDTFSQLLPLVDAVDVELYSSIRDDVVSLARKNKKSIVLSYHDFFETPPAKFIDRRGTSLEEIVDDATSAGVDMLKIAVMAKDFSDVKSLLEFTATYRGDMLLTTISMGDIGTISRVINPLVGSALTYGYIGDEPNAPGQISIKDMVDIFGMIPNRKVCLDDAEKIMKVAQEKGLLLMAS